MNFEELHKEFGSRGHSKGCPVCGARNAGAVAISLTKLTKNGAHAAKGRVGSRGMSFCEEHASEIFRRFVAALEQERVR